MEQKNFDEKKKKFLKKKKNFENFIKEEPEEAGEEPEESEAAEEGKEDDSNSNSFMYRRRVSSNIHTNWQINESTRLWQQKQMEDLSNISLQQDKITSLTCRAAILELFVKIFSRYRQCLKFPDYVYDEGQSHTLDELFDQEKFLKLSIRSARTFLSLIIVNQSFSHFINERTYSSNRCNQIDFFDLCCDFNNRYNVHVLNDSDESAADYATTAAETRETRETRETKKKNEKERSLVHTLLQIQKYAHQNQKPFLPNVIHDGLDPNKSTYNYQTFPTLKSTTIYYT